MNPYIPSGFGLYKVAAEPTAITNKQVGRPNLFADMGSGINSALTLNKYKNRISAGNMNDQEWDKVLTASKNLGGNRLAKGFGNFVTRGKYDNNYFEGMHQALTQVRDFQRMGTLRKAWTAVTGLNHKQRAAVGWLQKYHPDSLNNTPFSVKRGN